MRSRPIVALAAVLALISMSAAGRDISTEASSQTPPAPATVFSGWAGTEKAGFQSVLSYCSSHYHVRVTYQQASLDPAGELAARLRAGNPPDLAALSVTRDVAQYANRNALVPLTFLPMSRIKKQYPPFWLNEGTVNGKLYAVYLKADVKSLVWYAPGKFRAGHYSIPKTWSQLIQLSEKMIKAGKHPWAFGAQDGWTLTDFLENIYLSQNGPALYRKWYLHQIRWTDPTIRSAFSLLNQIVAKDSMIAGGRTRVLSQPWDEGAKQMVTDPQAEFFQEASFVVAGLRSELPKVREGADYSAFPFPMVRSWPATPVEVGPSGMVMLHNTPGARALMTCLTDPNALAQWAKRGDYISPNDALPSSDYPDPILRAAAALLARAGKADLVVGDASDEMPAALGSDYEYTELQRYFKDPSSLNMVLNRLEAKARQVYGH